MKKYDAITVLGGGLTETGDLNTLSMRRLDHGVFFWRCGLAPNIVVPGGYASTYMEQAAQDPVLGSQLRSEYLTAIWELRDKDIIQAEGGRDTIGETFVVRDRLIDLGLSSQVLVTSERHMERALRTFQIICSDRVSVVGDYWSSARTGGLLIPEEQQEYYDLWIPLESLPQSIPTPPSWEVWRETHRHV